MFDDCGGQNKNRMALRFLFLLVKLKITKIARAIFLVKGHTKNNCDRLFNPTKMSHRNENVHTPTELMAHISEHEAITAIPMEAEKFLNFDATEDKTIKLPTGIKRQSSR